MPSAHSGAPMLKKHVQIFLTDMERKELTPMPEKIERREIGKGIFLSRITDKRAKFNVVSINFITPISEETASEYAVLARILTKSNNKYPDHAKLNSKLSSLYAARLDGGVLGTDDVQFVTFTVEYIDNKYAFQNEKVGSEAIDILLSCLFDPLLENGAFSQKVTRLERQAVINEIEAEINDKYSYASQRIIEILYEGEPAGIRTLGTAAQAKRVSAKSAYKAYKRLLEHCRIEIICTGCSDFSDEKKIITDAFIKLEREEIFSFESKRSPLKNEPKRIYEEMEVTQSQLALGFKTECVNKSALKIMNEIYGGSSSSKLFTNIREKKSLCYYCWSFVNCNKGSFSVRSGIDKNNIDKTEKEILIQLEAMKNGDFSDENIEYAKIYRRNFLRAYYDSFKHMGAWYLIRIYEDDIKSPEDVIEEEARVNREDIINAARSLTLDTVYILAPKD